MRIAIIYNTVEADRKDAVAENEVVEIAQAVKKSLVEMGHEAVALKVSMDVLNSLAGADLVFNLAEGFGPNLKAEPYVAAMLELLEVPYTGSPSGTLDFCRNKYLTKLLLQSEDIPVPKFQLFKNPYEKLLLDFPLIVKPNTEDASIGITSESVVFGIDPLRKRVAEVIETYRQPAIVEEYIEGREINVSVLDTGEKEVLPASEILFDLPEGVPKIMSFEAKWIEDAPAYGKTIPKCPAEIEPETEAVIKELALRCFDLVGASGYARVDFRVRGREVFVLEINPNPCLNPEASGFVRSAASRGLDFGGVVAAIVNSALKRMPTRKSDEPAEFVSGRLALKEASIKDIGMLLKWFSDEKNTRFMEILGPIDEQDVAIGVLNTCDWDFIAYYDEVPIGFGSIYNIKSDSGELSFLIGEEGFKGRGIGKRICTTLLEFAFTRLNLKTVFAAATVENTPSIRTLEAVGFKRIGKRRSYQKVGEGYLDDILFDMMREDFMEKRVEKEARIIN